MRVCLCARGCVSRRGGGARGRWGWNLARGRVSKQGGGGG